MRNEVKSEEKQNGTRKWERERGEKGKNEYNKIII